MPCGVCIDWTPDKQQAFLDALANGASVAKAAKSVGVSRSFAYVQRDRDPIFSELWEDAYQSSIDGIEDYARNRAEKSDTIIMFLLRCLRPEKYAENKQDAAGITIAIRGGLSGHD